MPWPLAALLLLILLVLVVAVHDLTQRRHAILRNFPVVGHLRYLIERIGPELRQYVVASNDEELPFSRDDRRWVYTTAKSENNYFGFGTDTRFDRPGHLIFRHSAFPLEAPHHSPDRQVSVPASKVVGEWRDRPGAFRPASLVNISAMSFGSLSAPAIAALNRGAAIAGCLHNTGEGGISDHHRLGGELVFQIGTGYFGARDSRGSANLDALLASIADSPVRAVEVKLSQGAKPGLGGLLPGSKVTAEIARVRGIHEGQDCASPAAHSAFDGVAGLIGFVEEIASATGLPVGIKAAVGQEAFWDELAAEMAATGRGPDFIAVDGGEGGTGAAPLLFSDHVALPAREALVVVRDALARHGMAERVSLAPAGRLGLPHEAAVACALGADWIYAAREPMLAIGCIQAQKCHTGHCPTGVATHSRWLTRGLDPADKSARLANYVDGLRFELLRLAHACGVPHPRLLTPEMIALVSPNGPRPLLDRHPAPLGRTLSDRDRASLGG